LLVGIVNETPSDRRIVLGSGVKRGLNLARVSIPELLIDLGYARPAALVDKIRKASSGEFGFFMENSERDMARD
jgi:hypothetical protein